MAEDSSKNRMEEALELFEQIVNSHHFRDIDVMLFLNKVRGGARACYPGYRSNPERKFAIEVGSM